LGAAVVVAASGCEGPVPPPAPSRSRSSASLAKGTKPLELVPAPKPAGDVEYVRTAVRVQAGLEAVRAQAADSSAEPQAELVRRAIRSEPPALIVEAPAEPDAELARAVGEALAKGLPVVSLGRAVGASGEGNKAREVVVAPRPFRESAGPIVAAAMRNAGHGKLDPKAGAAILAETPNDPLVGERIDALKEALAAAGVAEIALLRFDRSLEAGRAALVEHLKAHPATTLVLGADGLGVDVAEDHAATAAEAGRPYVVAGYSADEPGAKSQVQMGEYAAIGVYPPERLIRKGVNVAAKLARGEKVPERVEIDVTVYTSPPTSGAAKGRTLPTPTANPAEAGE